MHREICSVNEFLICIKCKRWCCDCQTQSAERKTKEKRKEKIGRAHVFGFFKRQTKSIEAKLNENELWGPFTILPHRHLHEVAAAAVEWFLRHRTLKYTDFFRLVWSRIRWSPFGHRWKRKCVVLNEHTQVMRIYNCFILLRFCLRIDHLLPCGKRNIVDCCRPIMIYATSAI